MAMTCQRSARACTQHLWGPQVTEQSISRCAVTNFFCVHLSASFLQIYLHFELSAC